MEISDVIALLAFLLSIYGAVVSTLLVLEECLNLNLKFLNTCYLTLSYNEQQNNHGEYIKGYDKEKYTIAIYVRIINKSKSPTTINEFTLNNKYFLNSSFDWSNSLIPTSFKDCGTILTHQHAIILEKKTLKPLIELKPLSTTEGYLIFCQLDKVPKKFNIKLDAVQKSKTFHLKCNITDDYRNVIS